MRTKLRYKPLVPWMDVVGSMFKNTRFNKETEAKMRYARYYAGVLYATSQLYQKGNDDLVNGLNRLELEWENIRQGQRLAASLAPNNHAAAELSSRYPDAGVYCLELRQHPNERIQWLQDAVQAARQLNDRYCETACLGNLGLAYTMLALYQEAIACHQQSLAIDQELQHENGIASDWNNLGDYTQAEQYITQALELFERLSDRRGKALAPLNLGNVKNSRG